MKTLESPSTIGLPEAMEIQRMLETPETINDIKYDEIVNRLPTTEEGAIATIHYVFRGRYLPFDLACLVALITDMMTRHEKIWIPRDAIKALYTFTEEHLTEAERQIIQSTENAVPLWFIGQLRKFLRDRVEEIKP